MIWLKNHEALPAREEAGGSLPADCDMKYKAVIFDLFGTLIPSFSLQEYREKVRQMAAVLEVDPEEFWRQWTTTFRESLIGTFSSQEDRIIHIGRELGSRPDIARVKEAEQIIFKYEEETMLPRPEAPGVLAELKSMELKIGLISDCSPEAPLLWKGTSLAPYFDSTIFSCLAGMQKPDPGIYRLATEQLGVEARDCLYVGDGSSTELTGASRAGMHAVQIRVPGEDDPDVYRVNKEGWQGTIITSLKEVLDLVRPDKNR